MLFKRKLYNLFINIKHFLLHFFCDTKSWKSWKSQCTAMSCNHLKLTRKRLASRGQKLTNCRLLLHTLLLPLGPHRSHRSHRRSDHRSHLSDHEAPQRADHISMFWLRLPLIKHNVPSCQLAGLPRSLVPTAGPRRSPLGLESCAVHKCTLLLYKPTNYLDSYQCAYL